MPEPSKDNAFVIDSGSLLCYLRGEPGGALVQRVLRQCADCETQIEICPGDLLETYCAASGDSAPSLEELVSLIDQLPIRMETATRDSVVAAAQALVGHPELKPTQAQALSLAHQKGATLITADKNLAGLLPSLYVGPESVEGDLATVQEFYGNSPET